MQFNAGLYEWEGEVKEVRYLSFIFSLFFFSCYSCTYAQKVVIERQEPTAHIHDKFEYITNVKINGLLRLEDKFDKAVKILGSPDRIVQPNYSDVSVSHYDKPFKYYYFKGLEFEKYGDTLVFNSVDFRKSPNVYLTTNVLRLDKSTTIGEISKYFPKAVAHELSGTDLDKIQAISIDVSKPACDEQWILTFDRNTGYLIKVDYWMPD